jgi:catechol 2,3-dioxygenase-like lactoylglutathione lyase family enzyme
VIAPAGPTIGRMTTATGPPVPRPRLVGVNHVALEVGDVDAALAFYGAIFTLTGIEREGEVAFVAMGDQFLTLLPVVAGAPDAERHFGLVVDDRAAARAALEAHGVPILPGGRLDFRDPWGNRVQVVDYRDIQFTKAPAVLRGMGLAGLEKRAGALRELAEAGLSG